MAKMVKTEHQNEMYKLMYKAILSLETEEDCEKFFQDICSPAELSAMEQRFAVATLLMENKVYTEILEKTSASTATISRVKRMLTMGSGCVFDVIEKLKSE